VPVLFGSPPSLDGSPPSLDMLPSHSVSALFPFHPILRYFHLRARPFGGTTSSTSFILATTVPTQSVPPPRYGFAPPCMPPPHMLFLLSGMSIWGHEFEEDFHRSLRHDRPYTPCPPSKSCPCPYVSAPPSYTAPSCFQAPTYGVMNSRTNSTAAYGTTARTPSPKTVHLPTS
jgi:hypothetical protein